MSTFLDARPSRMASGYSIDLRAHIVTGSIISAADVSSDLLKRGDDEKHYRLLRWNRKRNK